MNASIVGANDDAGCNGFLRMTSPAFTASVIPSQVRGDDE
jgi:hypothetical protein